MPVCPACALDIHPASRFCGRCGAPLVSVPPVQNPDPHLEGIGGWLLLFAFSLAITPIAVAGNAARALHGFFYRDGIAASAVSIIYLLKNVVTFAALLLLNWLFYTRKRAFPRAQIGYYVWIVGTRLLEVLFLAGSSAGISAISRLWFLPIISAAICIPYFLVSRRVKATFVN